MSKERFTERQADVRESAARLAEAVAQPESELIRDATIVQDYAPLLGGMADKIQTLQWD
jgi:hypothetical protein